MDLGVNTAGLLSWRAAEQDVFAAVSRVAAHPHFAMAARALARNMLDLASEDRALDTIFKDAGRYFATMWSFALHEEGGLTLPRLKAVCARSGLLSPGRAGALLRLLEHYGYLQRRPGLRGAAAYAPTPVFLAAWDRQFIAALAAAEILEPQVGALLADPAARRAYGRIHADGMLGAMPAEPQVSGFLKVFLHPYAGSQIVWVLVASEADPAFPPARAGPISVAGLARRCGAARSQVARIFAEAEQAGLAHIDPEGMVVFGPQAREELGFFCAIQLVQILAAAARAVDP